MKEQRRSPSEAGDPMTQMLHFISLLAAIAILTASSGTSHRPHHPRNSSFLLFTLEISGFYYFPSGKQRLTLFLTLEIVAFLFLPQKIARFLLFSQLEIAASSIFSLEILASPNFFYGDSGCPSSFSRKYRLFTHHSIPLKFLASLKDRRLSIRRQFYIRYFRELLYSVGKDGRIVDHLLVPMQYFIGFLFIVILHAPLLNVDFYLQYCGNYSLYFSDVRCHCNPFLNCLSCSHAYIHLIIITFFENTIFSKILVISLYDFNNIYKGI